MIVTLCVSNLKDDLYVWIEEGICVCFVKVGVGVEPHLEYTRLEQVCMPEVCDATIVVGDLVWSTDLFPLSIALIQLEELDGQSSSWLSPGSVQDMCGDGRHFADCVGGG